MKALLLKILLAFASLLPLRVVHAFGAGIGWLFYVIPNRRRRTARINIDLCFPELTASARRRLRRHNLIEVGKTVTEIGVLWSCDTSRLLRLVQGVSGEDKLKYSLAQGKGIILAAPHLGAWEMVGMYCSMRYPITALYRSLSPSRSEELVRSARERLGARLFPADNAGIRELYKALARGEMVAMLPDQVPSSRSAGVFAPFFGIQANTMVLLSRLAIKSGAAVIFAYAERLPRGRGYHMHFVPGPAQINHDDLQRSATAVNAIVEQCARALPEQYQWIYKRFRGRPTGEPKFY